MKRSEILNKLQQLLDSKDGNDVLPYNLAEEVLSLCENAGMRPPFYRVHSVTGSQVCKRCDALRSNIYRYKRELKIKFDNNVANKLQLCLTEFNRRIYE